MAARDDPPKAGSARRLFLIPWVFSAACVALASFPDETRACLPDPGAWYLLGSGVAVSPLTPRDLVPTTKLGAFQLGRLVERASSSSSSSSSDARDGVDDGDVSDVSALLTEAANILGVHPAQRATLTLRNLTEDIPGAMRAVGESRSSLAVVIGEAAF